MINNLKDELKQKNLEVKDTDSLTKLVIFFINQIQKLTQLQQSSTMFLKNSIYSSVMMTNLINDLLDLAKMNNAAFKLNFEQANIVEQVEKAFAIIAFAANEKQIGLSMSIDKLKANIFKNALVDKRRILQILLNFLSNSLKFTGKGGFIKVHLRLLEQQIMMKGLGSPNPLTRQKSTPLITLSKI